MFGFPLFGKSWVVEKFCSGWATRSSTVKRQRDSQARAQQCRRLVHETSAGPLNPDAGLRRGIASSSARPRGAGIWLALRPPLCAFYARHGTNAANPLDGNILLTFSYHRKKSTKRRRSNCGTTRISWNQAWREDAKADEEGTSVGGWWPQQDREGGVQTWL